MNTDRENVPLQQRAIYNIGAVKRMTDIPAATLRVWERRYGFPSPERTSGGHRVYSEEDVAELRWVKARVDAGMQISQAVEALRTLKEEGRPLPPSTALPRQSTPVEREAPSLRSAKETLRDALLADDLSTADQVLGQVMALHPLEDLLLHVIRPTMEEIGERWLQGEISVADEHAATHYLRHRMILWMETGPPPYPVRPTLLACAPNEWHEGSLLMLGVMLRRRRWPVTYLGQALPLEDLAAFAKEARPLAITVVAMRAATAKSLIDWPRWLPDAAESGHPFFTYGGRVFTGSVEWRQRVPGIFLGEELREGLETLDRLLQKETGVGKANG